MAPTTATPPAELATLVLVFALAGHRARADPARPGPLRRRRRRGRRHRTAAGCGGWRAVAATLARRRSSSLAAFGAPTAQLAGLGVSASRAATRGTPTARALPRVPRQQPHADRRSPSPSASSSPWWSPTPAASPTRGSSASANRLTAVGYAVPGPVVAMGVILALVALDDAARRRRPRPARRRRHRLVHRPGLRLRRPLHGPGPEHGRVRPRPGARRGHGVGSLARRSAARRGRSDPPAAVAGRACSTAAVLVGVDALKELPIALLLRPIGFDTLPVWVYNLASESRFEQAALPALTIIAVALVPVALLSRRLDRAPSAASMNESGAAPARRHQGVRGDRRRRRRRPGAGRRRAAGTRRPERVRQVDAAAARRRADRRRRRRDRLGTEVVDDGSRRRRSRAPPRRAGVPGARPVPPPDGGPERGVRPASAAARRARIAVRRLARAGRARLRTAAATRTSCPAVSASASRSPARWRRHRG